MLSISVVVIITTRIIIITLIANTTSTARITIISYPTDMCSITDITTMILHATVVLSMYTAIVTTNPICEC